MQLKNWNILKWTECYINHYMPRGWIASTPPPLLHHLSCFSIDSLHYLLSPAAFMFLLLRMKDVFWSIKCHEAPSTSSFIIFVLTYAFPCLGNLSNPVVNALDYHDQVSLRLIYWAVKVSAQKNNKIAQQGLVASLRVLAAKQSCRLSLFRLPIAAALL